MIRNVDQSRVEIFISSERTAVDARIAQAVPSARINHSQPKSAPKESGEVHLKIQIPWGSSLSDLGKLALLRTAPYIFIRAWLTAKRDGAHRRNSEKEKRAGRRLANEKETKRNGKRGYVQRKERRGTRSVPCSFFLSFFLFSVFLSFFPPFLLKHLARDGSFKRDLLNSSASRLLQKARGHDLIESGHGARAELATPDNSSARRVLHCSLLPIAPSEREGTRAHFYSGKKGLSSVSRGGLYLSLYLSFSCPLTLLLR